MANVTNQTSPGVLCVGVGALTSTSKSLERRSARSLGWSVTFQHETRAAEHVPDRQAPACWTHTHSCARKGCFKCNRSPTWISIWPHFSCCELNIRAAEGHSRVSITPTPSYEVRCRFHAYRRSEANECSQRRRAHSMQREDRARFCHLCFQTDPRISWMKEQVFQFVFQRLRLFRFGVNWQPMITFMTCKWPFGLPINSLSQARWFMRRCMFMQIFFLRPGSVRYHIANTTWYKQYWRIQ